MNWFGPTAWSSPFTQLNERVPVPVGKSCTLCEEPIGLQDNGFYQADGDYSFHFECFIRVIVGSVGHQRGTCSCYGGTDEDPPGLSIRDAARAALLEYRIRALPGITGKLRSNLN